MATPGKVDYHVHYFIDGCADDEMTLPLIDTEAGRLGLEEICVLKHYSAELPNGEKAWAAWKCIVPDQFDTFLNDIASFRSAHGVRILSGVETELVDDRGKINITDRDAARLDAVVLSVHWLPEMEVLPFDVELWPGDIGMISPQAADRWRGKLQSVDVEAVMTSYVRAYALAIENNPKVRVLGHMNDGLAPMRAFEIPVERLGEKRLAEMLEPLFQGCVKNSVLWELTPQDVRFPGILRDANEVGVRFSATADAHFINPEGWANLLDHHKAEEYIDALGLTKGVIDLGADG